MQSKNKYDVGLLLTEVKCKCIIESDGRNVQLTSITGRQESALVSKISSYSF